MGLWSCPLRQLTGIPCPTCYLTRSVLATLHGDLAQALGLWTLLGGRLESSRLLQLACAAALLAFGYWLLRLWGWSQGQPLPA